MSVLKSKRFVVRKSLIGKNQIIEVTFKNGKVSKYNHDDVYNVMKSKLETMNCWNKYSEDRPFSGGALDPYPTAPALCCRLSDGKAQAE